MCDHGHDGCCHGEDQDFPPSGDDVLRYDMYQMIDKEKVTVLNETVEGSGVQVFKSMDDRLDKTVYVESDCDEELLFNIPFIGHVKLSGICFTGEEDASHPAKVTLFKDRPAMSFDDCAIECDQEIDLKMDSGANVDYPLKAAKFNNVTHLTIHVTKNFGSDATRVMYIGLRGEYQHEFRQRVAIATYEARAIPEDHKGEIPNTIGKMMF